MTDKTVPHARVLTAFILVAAGLSVQAPLAAAQGTTVMFLTGVISVTYPGSNGSCITDQPTIGTAIAYEDPAGMLHIAAVDPEKGGFLVTIGGNGVAGSAFCPLDPGTVTGVTINAWGCSGTSATLSVSVDIGAPPIGFPLTVSFDGTGSCVEGFGNGEVDYWTAEIMALSDHEPADWCAETDASCREVNAMNEGSASWCVTRDSAPAGLYPNLPWPSGIPTVPFSPRSASACSKVSGTFALTTTLVCESFGRPAWGATPEDRRAYIMRNACMAYTMQATGAVTGADGGSAYFTPPDSEMAADYEDCPDMAGTDECIAAPGPHVHWHGRRLAPYWHAARTETTAVMEDLLGIEHYYWPAGQTARAAVNLGASAPPCTGDATADEGRFCA